MKGPLVLEVTLLLAALTPSPAENFCVKINCSMDWVMVSVASYTYKNKYIHPDELYLGTGCPVTHIRTDEYDFVYRVCDCGIRIMVISENTLFLQTEIYYTSRDRLHRQKYYLACFASRKSVWLTPVSTENDLELPCSHFMADFDVTAEQLELNSTGCREQEHDSGCDLVGQQCFRCKK